MLAWCGGQTKSLPDPSQPMSLGPTIRSIHCALIVVSTTVLVSTPAFAQSSSRSPIRSSPTAQGSNSRTVAAAPTAINGYCPVCVIDKKQWIRGNPSIQASFDGRTYFFPAEEQRQKFLASPERYAPVLGGDCAVCLTDMQKRIPGSVHHAAITGGRLFLFPNAELKEKFRSDPGKYADADLALGGHCAVCRVEMNKAVPGRPDTAITYGGMRYQFPGEDQMKMFISNPTKYTGPAAGGSGSKPGGSGSR
jgi:YHS domain-containing protein